MQPVDNLFRANAANLSGTMNSHAGKAGFKIPEYQRTYDWKTENIKRLLEDCLNGFYYLSRPQAKESFTFLGTIILVNEPLQEPTFDGTSLVVVDGQQRLTTLSLLCCTLIEYLNIYFKDTGDFQLNIKSWLEEEVKFQLDTLYECVAGQLPERGKSYPFPRIVRDVDNRARLPKDAEYTSIIARFLKDFSNYYSEERDTFQPNRYKGDAAEDRLFENYYYIKDAILLSLYKDDNASCNLDYESVAPSHFERTGLRGLFEKSSTIGDKSARDRAFSEIANRNDSAGIIRLILFSSYLTKCVVLTRVETDNEKYAFDIFDALNTTGEPLTAIETLRPKIIEFEDKIDGYKKSVSKTHLDNIKLHLDDVFTDTDKRQKATKELLVLFALYLEGHKLSLNLNSQRTYLRSRFDSISGGKAANLERRFISSLSDVIEFRHCYWHAEKIRNLDSIHNSLIGIDLMKLCFEFIRDMNTSMAIPLLARYWVQYRKNGDQDSFFSAVKSITAFIVFRRAVTGNTGGIDSEFRRIMHNTPNIGGNPLCAGLDHSHELIHVNSLKKELITYLSKIDITDGPKWVKEASKVDLAARSRKLCRFILLAAAHNARPDIDIPGLLSRQDVRASEELNFLNFRTWESDNYATVEHIAPSSDSGSGWDVKIYHQLSTRDTLGNLTLLPKNENSAIGNSGWQKKKIFYSALAAITGEDANLSLQRAKDQGYEFKKKTEEMLLKGERLHLLDPLIKVSEWNKDLIEDRTKNILELAWDEISPWLYE